MSRTSRTNRISRATRIKIATVTGIASAFATIAIDTPVVAFNSYTPRVHDTVTKAAAEALGWNAARHVA